VGKSVAKVAKPLQPTAPARRALAARAAGSENIDPTAAQLLAAEEARRVAVESEAQMADLLAAADDRGNQFSAEAVRAGKAEARSGHTYVWGRTYVALKEGVGTLDSSVEDERARGRAERAASEGDPDCGLHAFCGPGRGGTTVQYSFIASTGHATLGSADLSLARNDGTLGPSALDDGGCGGHDTGGAATEGLLELGCAVTSP